MELPENKRQSILNAIYGGGPRKIESIRLLREATGCGLKEAKEFVEKLSDELYAKEPEKFTAAPASKKSGCVGVVMAVAVISSAAVVLVMMLV